MCLVLRLNCPLLQFNSRIPNTSWPFLIKQRLALFYIFTLEETMKKKAEYRWYVDPCGDPYSNETIAVQLSANGDLMEQRLRDNKGIVRCVYEIDRNFLQKISLAKKKDENLKVRFFVRKGNGAIREWTFENKKKKSAKVKAVEKRIKEIKK